MRYAAYGSNLHPLRLNERIPSAQLLGTSFVDGWSLYFHKRSKDLSGKCNILAGTDGIHVAVYEMSEHDKRALDIIEGLGFGYSDMQLDVPKFGLCSAYAADDSHIDDTVMPYDWYRELVLLGAIVHQLPDAYTRMIRTTRACRDPDSSRHRIHWARVETIRGGFG